jgi:hypothetical protein
MTRRSVIILQVLAGAVFFLGGCGTQEVQLLPAEREGIFYTSLATAEQVAQSEGKHMLLELWRPG